MQLSELYLNRYLYRDDQDSQTPDALYVSSNATDIPSNFIAYGGNSAIDVNTNTTTINGGKIRTGDVESTGYKYVSGIFSSVGMQINLDTGAIISKQFAIDSAGNAYFTGDISGASGTFTGNITVGTGNSVFKVFTGTGMWLGNAVFASAPFRVDMTGNVTASSVTMTNASISTGSTWTGNQIADAYIGNLNANKITTGTLTVGDGTSHATILINQSTSGGGGSDAFLRWSGGSRIWSDGSNNMGINAIGGSLTIYGNSNQIAIFQDASNKIIFYQELSMQNTLYLGNGSQTYIWGNDNSNTIVGAPSYFYVKIGAYPGTQAVRISVAGLTIYGNGAGSGALYMPNSHIISHGAVDSTLPASSGTLKNAIVPTSKGFNALTCMESPEVWFMDFCMGTRTEDVDPLFLEVTVPPYHFIMCEGGEYQVWGKRKGYDHVRFEEKTEEEFLANERFLQMSKPSY